MNIQFYRIIVIMAKRWIIPGSIIFAIFVLSLLFFWHLHSSLQRSIYSKKVPFTQGKDFGPNLFTQRYNKGNGIAIAFTVCGNRTRLEQAVVMLKSAVLFTRVELNVHIFADDHLQSEFRNMVSRWPQQFLKNLSYRIHNISFPDNVVPLDNDTRGWRDMFRPCATQRLFFYSILTEVDALIYVDTDVLFLSPPEHLWNYFRQFNARQEMAASNARQYVDPKELMKKGIPVLTKDEINSGVMLFNLTRMRASNFNESIHQYRKQYGSLLRGDQAILSIYRVNYPDRMYIFPCEWNYRPRFCRVRTKERCLVAEETGARLIHGTGYRFEQKEVKTMWQAMYKAFEQFDLGHNVVSDLIPFVEDSLKLVKASVNKFKDFKCETSSFVKLMYERSRSHLTKDNHYIQIKSDKGHSLNPDQILQRTAIKSRSNLTKDSY